MTDTADEAGAALAVASRLAIMIAGRGEKAAVLAALTDCMESLLEMKRPGAARLLQDLHTAIEEELPEDVDPPPA